jgi:hypothetical protein
MEPTRVLPLNALELLSFIDETRKKLIVIHRSLKESETSWRSCGFAWLENPSAKVLRRDMDECEVLLTRCESSLASISSGTDLPSLPLPN